MKSGLILSQWCIACFTIGKYMNTSICYTCSSILCQQFVAPHTHTHNYSTSKHYLPQIQHKLSSCGQTSAAGHEENTQRLVYSRGLTNIPLHSPPPLPPSLPLPQPPPFRIVHCVMYQHCHFIEIRVWVLIFEYGYRLTGC